MSHMIHELPDEFPHLAGRMQELKTSDAAFARMYDAYHAINAEVIRAETLVAPTEHFHEEDLKKQRAHLKDELYKVLTA